jgi:hypothetical protein
MEVPEYDTEAVSDATLADNTFFSGAKISRQVPKQLKLALASELSVAPTVIAEGTKAGENPQASALSLPAATTTTTPAFVTSSIAVFTEGLLPPPPKLALTTPGLRFVFFFTQSSASIIQAKDPDPSSPKTFTEWSVDSLATPKLLPPIVPAQ